MCFVTMITQTCILFMLSLIVRVQADCNLDLLKLKQDIKDVMPTDNTIAYTYKNVGEIDIVKSNAYLSLEPALSTAGSYDLKVTNMDTYFQETVSGSNYKLISLNDIKVKCKDGPEEAYLNGNVRFKFVNLKDPEFIDNKDQIIPSLTIKIPMPLPANVPLNIFTDPATCKFGCFIRLRDVDLYNVGFKLDASNPQFTTPDLKEEEMTKNKIWKTNLISNKQIDEEMSFVLTATDDTFTLGPENARKTTLTVNLIKDPLSSIVSFSKPLYNYKLNINTLKITGEQVKINENRDIKIETAGEFADCFEPTIDTDGNVAIAYNKKPTCPELNDEVLVTLNAKQSSTVVAKTLIIVEITKMEFEQPQYAGTYDNERKDVILPPIKLENVQSDFKIKFKTNPENKHIACSIQPSAINEVNCDISGALTVPTYEFQLIAYDTGNENLIKAITKIFLAVTSKTTLNFKKSLYETSCNIETKKVDAMNDFEISSNAATITIDDVYKKCFSITAKGTKLELKALGCTEIFNEDIIKLRAEASLNGETTSTVIIINIIRKKFEKQVYVGTITNDNQLELEDFNLLNAQDDVQLRLDESLKEILNCIVESNKVKCVLKEDVDLDDCPIEGYLTAFSEDGPETKVQIILACTSEPSTGPSTKPSSSTEPSSSSDSPTNSSSDEDEGYIIAIAVLAVLVAVLLLAIIGIWYFKLRNRSLKPLQTDTDNTINDSIDTIDSAKNEENLEKSVRLSDADKSPGFIKRPHPSHSFKNKMERRATGFATNPPSIDDIPDGPESAEDRDKRKSVTFNNEVISGTLFENDNKSDNVST